MIRVAIADDHPIMLDGLEYLFRKEEGFEVVARCETADEAVRAVAETLPDVLLLDFRMPEKDGLWVLEQLRDTHSTPVVLLTAGVADAEIARAFQLGASGVVLKQRTSEDLVKCVREVHAGGRWIDEGIARRAVNLLIASDSPNRLFEPALTPREAEIIELVAQGLRNKEIAQRLSVSVGTVKTHLRSIFPKIPVSGRVGLAIWAQERNRD